MDERGCTSRASASVSLSLRELCVVNLKGAPLPGTLEDVYRKALETGISLHRGPTGEPGRGLVYQGL